MNKLILLAGILSISGCQLLYPPLDTVFDAIVDQINKYCALPYSDRLGGYVIINGRLIETHVSIECPGDPKSEAEPVNTLWHG